MLILLEDMGAEVKKGECRVILSGIAALGEYELSLSYCLQFCLLIFHHCLLVQGHTLIRFCFQTHGKINSEGIQVIRLDNHTTL